MSYLDPVPWLAMWLLAAPVVLAALSLAGTKTSHRSDSESLLHNR